MRTIRRREFLVIAGGAVAAAGLAACGGDDDDSGDPTAAANTPSGGTTPNANVTAGTDNGALGLRWFGQSMFIMTSPGGTTVLLDPFNDIGYTLPAPLNSDAATITHEHPDHNNDALAGTATVLRGLTADGWADIDQTFGDVRITTVETYHDDQQGAMRGRNAAFIFETADLRIAHLGDLGHILTETQRAAFGAVDILMVPTGGSFTIGPAEATSVTEQLAPKMVFPMHYQTPRVTLLSNTADPFLEGKTIERVGATDIRIARDMLPAERTAYVLEYE